MKTVFAALNAKYIHTNLAVRSVAAWARRESVAGIAVWERTVNHQRRLLLRELAALEPDVLIFSLYIWNTVLAGELAADLRQLYPTLVLAAAGPEASHRPADFLAENTVFDYVLPGEGEAVTADFLRWLEQMPADERRQGRSPCRPGILGRGGEDMLPEPLQAPPVDMAALPFAYGDELPALEGRILYYESMRGCPFRCSYCLSSVESGPVRMRPLALVFDDLRRFLDAGARQVKFVDRTFNCDPRRARDIWSWLGDNDNGRTGFHFELAAQLLDQESCELLASLRPGQVQLEIGVQSVNPDTLAAIHRPVDTAHLFRMVRRVREPGNVHLHLDLIAGLPLEGYASFRASFNQVYAQRPHQLQLGFLKVLRGAAMEGDAPRYGIRHSATAPYEVLCTDHLSFRELGLLHGVADMVELYHNSGRFSHLVGELCGQFKTPFDFYEALARFFRENGHDAAPPSKVGYYEILGDFMIVQGIPTHPRRQWLCRYDMALHEKPKRVPQWVKVDGFTPNKARILAHLQAGHNLARLLPRYSGQDPRYVVKVAHFEVFPFHPETGEPGETAVLFDYQHRDMAGRAGTQVLELEG